MDERGAQATLYYARRSESNGGRRSKPQEQCVVGLQVYPRESKPYASSPAPILARITGHLPHSLTKAINFSSAHQVRVSAENPARSGGTTSKRPASTMGGRCQVRTWRCFEICHRQIQAIVHRNVSLWTGGVGTVLPPATPNITSSHIPPVPLGQASS